MWSPSSSTVLGLWRNRDVPKARFGRTRDVEAMRLQGAQAVEPGLEGDRADQRPERDGISVQDLRGDRLETCVGQGPLPPASDQEGVATGNPREAGSFWG